MDIGFVGLGKLGLPVALAMESRGHRVCGCDIDPAVGRSVADRRLPYREEAAQALLADSGLAVVTLAEVVARAELIFVCIQTPHEPAFEGATRLPDQRADFDYGALARGVSELSAALDEQGADRTVVIVSTVLPGTLRREILPLVSPRVRLCYNPFFIAMGTTVPDFLAPEFVLLGVTDEPAAEQVEAFYRTIHDAPVFRTNLENAELIKVVYNTYISTKLGFINTVMELSHRLPGTDVDQVTAALSLAHERILSARYLRGGMGDGGGCHPRDNIALSWLSKKHRLRYDWFEQIMLQRERQTEWFAALIAEHVGELPVVLLGKAFKADSDITTGSPALLLSAVLDEQGRAHRIWDPHVDGEQSAPTDAPALFFVATRHEAFRRLEVPAGSVILDPWRYVEPRAGVRLVPIGRGPRGLDDDGL